MNVWLSTSYGLALIALVLCLAESVFADGKVKELPNGLKIEYVFKPDGCEAQSKQGESLTMHYTGTLADGTKFDSR
jgi:FKBP-type peptidyl-prolyl cis-trans isomerases 1